MEEVQDWSSVFEKALTRDCEPASFRRDEWPPNQRVIPSFIIYDVFDPPTDLDLGRLALRITGRVRRPVEVPYIDILTRILCVDLEADFHCVTGWSVRNVRWRGVRVEPLLREAGPEGNYALVIGLDGYTTNMPIEALMEDTTIIAYAMNGRILPREHGFPLRLVVPSRYGWKSAKYVVEIRVLDDNVLGYWELLGYHDNADPWLEERFRYEGGRHVRRRGARVEGR